MIGDALTDVMAGKAAGVERTALVLTGRGEAQAERPEADGIGLFAVYDDLSAALADLLRCGDRFVPAG